MTIEEKDNIIPHQLSIHENAQAKYKAIHITVINRVKIAVFLI
jgi:hypothetical protein